MILALAMLHSRVCKGFVTAAVTVAVAVFAAGCGDGSGDKPAGEGSGSKPAVSTGAATGATAASAAAKGAEPGKTLYKTLGGSLTLELPTGAEVSDDGSVFGPGKLELSVYVEDAAKAPKTDVASRKVIIEGRSVVKKVTSDSTLPDGWVVLFEGERGLGFECGRLIGGRRFVFWGDRAPDEATRTLAVDACKKSRP